MRGDLDGGLTDFVSRLGYRKVAVFHQGNAEFRRPAAQLSRQGQTGHARAQDADVEGFCLHAGHCLWADAHRFTCSDRRGVAETHTCA